MRLAGRTADMGGCQRLSIRTVRQAPQHGQRRCPQPYCALGRGQQRDGYIAFNLRADGYEIGYCFHSDYHGKGYARESLSALMAYMKDLGAAKLTAGTAINNTPSVRLLTALGFRLTKVEKVSFYKDDAGNDIVFDGGVYERTLYSLGGVDSI